MAQRVGKCTNYSGCKLAYRNEKITVVTKDFRCPECGSPLEAIGPKKTGGHLPYVYAGIGAVLLFAVGAVLWTLFNPRPHPVVIHDESPTPIPVTPTPTPAPTSTPTPGPTATPEGSATPAPTPGASPPLAPLNFDTGNPEIAAVRREVLSRIEQSPYPQAQKDRASELVLKAHGMGRLFTVSFETALNRLPPQAISSVQSAANQPQVQKILSDPAVVLVLLGFADKQGNDVKNQQLSQERAQNILELLKEKGGIMNVMYPVAMGGTEIFDAKELAKNRVVEVWAVLP